MKTLVETVTRRAFFQFATVGVTATLGGYNALAHTGANDNYPQPPPPRSGRYAKPLDKISERNLLGVHPDLVAVARRAAEITAVPFRVTEGVRTLKRQKELLKQGATTTLNSRHIPGRDGWGKAIDLVALPDGKVSWDWKYYHLMAAAMKAAAKELQVGLEWGGDWRTFKDGPHFQLPRAIYP